MIYIRERFTCVTVNLKYNVSSRGHLNVLFSVSSVQHFVSVFAAGVCNKLKWLLSWPLCLLLYYTVPNCSKPEWEKWFMLSFIASTLWIAAFSYVMVWMVNKQDKTSPVDWKLSHVYAVPECPQNETNIVEPKVKKQERQSRGEFAINRS